MSKDIWIAKYDELVEEYMLDHPDADESEAHKFAEAKIDDRYADTLGDMIDAARTRAKYERT